MTTSDDCAVLAFGAITGRGSSVNPFVALDASDVAAVLEVAGRDRAEVVTSPTPC